MAGDGHSEHPLGVTRPRPLPLNFYLDVAKRWSPSAMRFGALAGCMFLYFTDWKVFMTKVPFYNGKFEEKEPLFV